eukprot:30588-Pelagococcus_subviridis.AAC.3
MGTSHAAAAAAAAAGKSLGKSLSAEPSMRALRAMGSKKRIGRSDTPRSCRRACPSRPCPSTTSRARRACTRPRCTLTKSAASPRGGPRASASASSTPTRARDE